MPRWHLYPSTLSTRNVAVGIFFSFFADVKTISVLYVVYSMSKITSLRKCTLRRTLYVNINDVLYVEHSTSKNVSLREYTLRKTLYVVFSISTSKNFLSSTSNTLRRNLYVKQSTSIFDPLRKCSLRKYTLRKNTLRKTLYVKYDEITNFLSLRQIDCTLRQIQTLYVKTLYVVHST